MGPNRDAALERDLRGLLSRYGIAIDEGSTPSPSQAGGSSDSPPGSTDINTLLKRYNIAAEVAPTPTQGAVPQPAQEPQVGADILGVDSLVGSAGGGAQADGASGGDDAGAGGEPPVDVLSPSPAPSPPQDDSPDTVDAQAQGAAAYASVAASVPGAPGWVGDYSEAFQDAADRLDHDLSPGGAGSSGSSLPQPEVTAVEEYDFDKILQLNPDIAAESEDAALSAMMASGDEEASS